MGGTVEIYTIGFTKKTAELEADKKLGGDLFAKPAAPLCSEAEVEECHRSLVVEYLNEKWGGSRRWICEIV